MHSLLSKDDKIIQIGHKLDGPALSSRTESIIDYSLRRKEEKRKQKEKQKAREKKLALALSNDNNNNDNNNNE